MSSVSQEARGVGSPGAGDTGVCEPPDGGVGNCTRSPQEQFKLLRHL